MWQVKTRDDHRAFAQLVERWEEPIRRLCTRMVGDSHRGDDLKQEAFARLFEKRKNYEPTGRFSTYLWRLALNLCYDEIRRVNRRREFLSDGETGEESGPLDICSADDPGPDEQAVAQEESELVRNALLRLPDIYRSVLVLRHYEGLKLAKIAEILDIPLGTVNSRLADGMARLSRLLEPRLAERRSELPAPEPPNRPTEMLVI